MAFGVYIHIPYCLQRCSYCDFATYEHSKILPPDQYIQILKSEMLLKQNLFGPQDLDTLYFGGGTPSLLQPELIVTLIDELANLGFKTRPNAEVTIEINPATINEQKLDQYLKAGINRFSVGAQTFDNNLLKDIHREHNAQQTLETLELLKKYDLNFSFDVLFALPKQTIEGLNYDLDMVEKLGPTHVSPYCLTVPSSHPLSKGRPPEEDQVRMFDIIKNRLESAGYHQYEISNFSKKGFESQHNILYWNDDNYWGIGLSAHSYKNTPNWGSRFWNLNSINEYVAQIEQLSKKNIPFTELDFTENQIEFLEEHQSLTDFCHTALRRWPGLNVEKLRKKFSVSACNTALSKAEQLVLKNWLVFDNNCYSLSKEGVLISNLVFEAFTFLKEEI